MLQPDMSVDATRDAVALWPRSAAGNLVPRGLGAKSLRSPLFEPDAAQPPSRHSR